MPETILVNKEKIEKKVIYDFINQGREVDAVKYLIEKAGIGIKAAKKIVDMFQDKSIENFGNSDIYKEITLDSEELQVVNNISEPINAQKPKRHFLRNGVIVFCLLAAGAFLFLKYFIGFQHVGTHWRDLQSLLFNNQNEGTESEGAQIAVATNFVQDPLESPIDTLIWGIAKRNNQHIPEGVEAEIERYKKRDFSKLVVAEDVPSDDEAQQAIVRYYKDEVVKLLERENAHIKIGTCYKAPLQKTDGGDMEIARVTAMVSAFNDARGNLGNIQLPLDVIYDFVKFESDPETWYLSDFSQNIPYDEKLNKDRW